MAHDTTKANGALVAGLGPVTTEDLIATCVNYRGRNVAALAAEELQRRIGDNQWSRMANGNRGRA